MAMQINGFCDEQFLPLKDAFRANFDQGLELGASLAVTHRGNTVVDLWAGYADLERTKPWQEDTIVPIASTTKIANIVSLLTLVDRGLIELDRPVAYYWPEFAQGGKAAVTVRDALSHQAGVPGFEQPVTSDFLQDRESVTDRIAAEPHWFEGRKTVCYHMFNNGYLLGELIRRVDGRMPARFFRDEIASKLDLDFQIGLSSKSDLPRVAEVIMPKPRLDLPDGILGKLLKSVVMGDVTTWEARRAEFNGIANGRSIATLMAMLAMGGEFDGRRYLSKSIIGEASREQAYGQCPYLGWVKFGLGFGLHSKEFPAPSETCIGWGGVGGSWAIADPRVGVSLGYAPNNWDLDRLADPRLHVIGGAFAKLLATF